MPQVNIVVINANGEPYAGSMVVWPIVPDSWGHIMKSPSVTIGPTFPQLDNVRTVDGGGTRTIDDGSTRTIDSSSSIYTVNLEGGSYKLVLDLVDTVYFRVPSIGGPFNLAELVEV